MKFLSAEPETHQRRGWTSITPLQARVDLSTTPAQSSAWIVNVSFVSLLGGMGCGLCTQAKGDEAAGGTSRVLRRLLLCADRRDTRTQATPRLEIREYPQLMGEPNNNVRQQTF